MLEVDCHSYLLSPIQSSPRCTEVKSVLAVIQSKSVSSSIRVAGGGKRKDTTRLRAFQRVSIGLRSGEYAGHAIRAIPSLSRANLDSSVYMALPQYDTVQLPSFRHHFNRAPFFWTDRGKQTPGTRAYSPFTCNLWRTVAADISLSIDAVNIDVTGVEVALRFRLAAIEIY
ncbi:uncharacterized protein TNCV_640331 [Trichonephila clavipes]|nr:uncharacterized protein TNCV_640331 [Trichonephila clavipes]